MNRVFSLGPIETTAGEGYMLTLMDGERAVRVESGATALDALRSVVDQLGSDAVVASLELRDEARALGVRVAPLPQSICAFRAAQALVLGNGGSLAPEAGGEALPFLATLVSYVEAAPWHWLDGETPLGVQYRQGKRRARTLEASVLGNAGEVFGLALYDRPGSVAKLGQGPIEAHDVVLLTLDDEPSWAVEAMRAGFGLPFFPCLARVRRRRACPLAVGDLHRLEAVLWAAAKLAPDQRMVEGSFGDGGGRQASVRVEIGQGTASSEPARQHPDSPPAKISRNARCPCGSGRKYKRCCLPKHEPQKLPAPRGGPARLPAEDLISRLFSFMGREQPDHERRWLEVLLGGSELPEKLMPAVVPMLFYELPLVSGETLVDRFLARRGRRLDVEDRRSLESSSAARFSIWEVLRVDSGHGLELVDLLTGERCFVHEVSGSRNMRVRASLLTRVIERGERRELDGLYPRWLSPSSVDVVVAALRQRLGVRKNKKWVDRQLLHTPEVPALLFELWHGQVEGENERPEEPVVFVNTDGDPIEHVYDRYELVDELERLLGYLLELPGTVDRGVDDEGVRRLDWVREGNAVHRYWLSTDIGQLELRGSTLTLTTNSRRRADALRAAVEGRLGLFARFLGRELQAPAPMNRPGGGRIALDSQPVSVWFSPPPALVHGLHFRFWRHEPNDKLGGQTPCDAAARAAPRRKLHALLREHEHGADEHLQHALVQLRRELGMDELGGRVRVSAKQRMEVKISGRLFEFAAPLLMCSVDDEEGEAIMRVAAEVWNLVGESGADAVDRVALLDDARGALMGQGLEVEDERVRSWIETLIPARALYDDPRIMQILEFDRGEEMFNCRVAALVRR